MVYLIIGIVLLLVLVPIFSVLPSARQKQQMMMRQTARAAGVSVDLTIIDDPNPDQDKYLSHTGRKIPAKLEVVAYRIQRQRGHDWQRLSDLRWCLERRLDGGWVWVTDGELLSKEMRNFLDKSTDDLPADVERIEESRHKISVYWHEKAEGDEDYVLKFLRQCAHLPLHEHPPDKGLTSRE